MVVSNIIWGFFLMNKIFLDKIIKVGNYIFIKIGFKKYIMDCLL